MASYAEVESRMTAAIASLDSGDYAGAINQALGAQGLLAIIPDGQKEGEAGARLAFNHEAIDAFIERVRKQQSSATSNGTLQIATTEFIRRPTEC